MARRRAAAKSRYHKKAMKGWELSAETRAAELAAQNPVKVTKVEPGLTLAEMRARVTAGGEVEDPSTSPVTPPA